MTDDVQFAGVVYTTVEVPGAIPENRPDATPIVPTAGDAEDHVPAGTASESGVVSPAHTEAVPVIAATGFTVTTTLTGVQLVLV